MATSINHIFNRHKISRRLLMISVAFTLPIGVTLTLYVAQVNSAVAFTDLELKGSEYQRRLEVVLGGISQHFLLSRGSGPVTGPDEEDATRIAGLVDVGFRDLAATDARIGMELQFTEDGLAQRGREHLRVTTVQREWQDLLQGMAGNPEAWSSGRYRHLIEDIRRMITHVGDTSNLILDPDLDTYYTMDTTLLALPQTQGRVPEMVELLHSVGTRGILTDAERGTIRVAAGMLRENALDRIAANVQTALNEDKNFNGESASLQRQLPAASQSYLASMTTFVSALDALVAAPQDRALVSVALAAARRTQEASFDFWATAATNLDDLLQTRRDHLAASRTRSLVWSGAAWAGALFIVFGITRSITGPLAAMSAELATSSTEVTAAAGQMALSAQTLSQVTTDQASALRETAVAIEQLAAKTRQNAGHAQVAAGLITDVETRVSQSHDALGEMVNSMQAIRESSQQVAKVIRTIDEIAFQTSILALNAAVEAARAGEAGMGFAVVADEVRSLAQRSAQAAKVTAELIEASLANTQAGAQRVEQMVAAIGAITDGVSKVTGLVTEVNVASQQQAQGIAHVSKAVVQMERATQTAAQSAERSAAASVELNAESETALGVVRQLRLLVAGGPKGGFAPATQGGRHAGAPVEAVPASR